MSEIYKSSAERIVKNTIMLYFRQILILLVSLFTSRVVLQNLGVEDYGIYNVVGGFVTLFNVVSGAFSSAISRFMSYELGKGEKKELIGLYSTVLMIQIGLGIILCGVILISGYWYVLNKMVVPDERINATLCVLVTSILSFFVSLINTPYNAMIVAHEHMKAFAYIALVESGLKLGVAVLLSCTTVDKLILYGNLMLLSSVITTVMYVIYCKKCFVECKFQMKFDKEKFSELFHFISWSFIGNAAVVVKEHGLTLILNLFGGPVVNAARGIATQVNSAVSSFINNYARAVQPQITKLRASEQLDTMKNLVNQTSRFSYYLMLILCLPVIKNIDILLSLWLGEVPERTALFVSLTLIDSLIVSINNPVLYGLLAAGNVKTYSISIAIIYGACIPITYAMLKIGLPIWIVYVSIIVFRIMITILLIQQSAANYGLSPIKFVREVVLNVFVVSIIPTCISFFINVKSGVVFIDFVVESMIVVATTIACIWLVGLRKQERANILKVLKKKMRL